MSLDDAASEYVLYTDHSPFSGKYDAFKAGAIWQSSQPINSELTQLKAENERLKSSLEHVRRCMVGWKSHLHPDLLTLKTIDKILIEHSNH
jgi:hypothetical protein